MNSQLVDYGLIAVSIIVFLYLFYRLIFSEE